MSESIFLEKISYSCRKKESLFQVSKTRYALRSILAGMFLTMSTAVGAFGAEKISHINPNLGKFVFAFLFAWGLVYILFLNAELATSNMMYLTAGVYRRDIQWKKALSILVYCTLFNCLGAALTGVMFASSTAFSGMDVHHFIISMIEAKLTRSNSMILLEGILANILVNVAIISYLIIDDKAAKLPIILSAVFLFVFIGNDHVVANFASFLIVKFHPIAAQLDFMSWMNILRQWLFAFIGNFIGGGLIMGLGYAWLNSTSAHYHD